MHYLVARLAGPDIHSAFLDEPDPQRQRAIEERVHCDSSGGVVLGRVEAELVIPEEARGADSEGGVAQGEAHVAEGVRLLEV